MSGFQIGCASFGDVFQGQKAFTLMAHIVGQFGRALLLTLQGQLKLLAAITADTQVVFEHFGLVARFLHLTLSRSQLTLTCRQIGGQAAMLFPQPPHCQSA